MRKHTFLCEEAIKNKQPQKMVDNTSAIARLANRVLLVAKQESDNSEDPNFIDEVNQASDALQSGKVVFCLKLSYYHLFLFRSCASDGSRREASCCQSGRRKCCVTLARFE